MKYIKKFESANDNLRWDSDEIKKLKSIGFIFSNIHSSCNYDSKSENLFIEIEKPQLVSFTFKFGDLNWKYVVSIYKNGKLKNKKFSKNSFDEMLDFVSNIIPDVDKQLNKYNL